MYSCPPFLLLLYGRPVNQYDISGHVTGQGSPLSSAHYLFITRHVTCDVTGHVTGQGIPLGSAHYLSIIGHVTVDVTGH